MKYLPGDLYHNSLASGMADIFGMVASGFIIQELSAKETLRMFFLIAGLSGLYLIYDQTFTAFFLVLSRGCICATGNIMFYLTVEMFRPSVSATAMGVCNIVSRMLTIASPVIVELKEPLPLSIYTFLCFAAVIAVYMLDNESEEK